MKVHAREGVLVLEGPAELEAAMLICRVAARSRRRRDRETSVRAQRIIDEAARIDVHGWRIGNPERALPLTLPDAELLVSASRAYVPPRRRPHLHGDDAIDAATRRFAAVEL